MKQLILIDGRNIAFADYHTHRSEQNEAGAETGLIDGFLASLLKLARLFPQATQVVVWDGPGNSWRKIVSKGRYKGNRIYDAGDPIRASCFRQIDAVREILGYCQVPQVMIPKTEADDVIAVLAKTLSADFERIVIRSGDRDFLQLADETIAVLRSRFASQSPLTAENVDKALMTPNAIYRRYGVSPTLWPMFRALTGDASDNLAGLAKGVGEVTARELLAAGLRVPVPMDRIPRAAHKRLARIDISPSDWARVNENYELSCLPTEVAGLRSAEARQALKRFLVECDLKSFRRDRRKISLWILGKMLGQWELSHLMERLPELVGLF